MLFLDDCMGLLPLLRLIRQGIIPIIQIGIPIILILLGMIDLGKAVMASKEDEIKKAQSMLLKRCIYAAAIFFVVLIVNVVMGLLTVTNDTDVTNGSTDWKTCWESAGQ